LSFNFLILLLLSSRMLIIVTVAIFFGIVNYFLWRKNKLLAVGVNMLSVLALLVAFSQLTILKERFLGTFGLQKNTQYIQKWGGDKGNIDIREQKWRGAILVIKDAPFLGVGTGDLEPVLMEKYKEIGFSLGIERKFDP